MIWGFSRPSIRGFFSGSFRGSLTVQATLRKRFVAGVAWPMPLLSSTDVGYVIFQIMLSRLEAMPFAWAGIAAIVGCDYSTVRGKSFTTILPLAVELASQKNTVIGLIERATDDVAERRNAFMGVLCFLLHPVMRRDGSLRRFCDPNDPTVQAIIGKAEGHPWLPGLLSSDIQGSPDPYTHIGCRPCYDTHPPACAKGVFDRSLLPKKKSLFRSTRGALAATGGWKLIQPKGDAELPKLDLGVITHKFQHATSILEGGIQRASELLDNFNVPLAVRRIELGPRPIC